jgi:hypothetical protein
MAVGLPSSPRWSRPCSTVPPPTDLSATGLVEEVSTTTLWRWLEEDPSKPWRHRSWIFPRDPDFAAKAGVVLDLYDRSFQSQRLGEGEYVISADEKTGIQARCRCHPTLPSGAARTMRVEHEYQRGGALAYLAAWDVHRARLFGRCEPTTGIGPFGRLVEQVMTVEPYASATRVFWIVDNGSSHRGRASVQRLEGEWAGTQRLPRPGRGRSSPARLPAPLPADRRALRLALHSRRPGSAAAPAECAPAACHRGMTTTSTTLRN